MSEQTFLAMVILPEVGERQVSKIATKLAEPPWLEPVHVVLLCQLSFNKTRSGGKKQRWYVTLTVVTLLGSNVLINGCSLVWLLSECRLVGRLLMIALDNGLMDSAQ